MKIGDKLAVTNGDYSGYVGVMVDLTRDGQVVVEFGGRWRASFSPHHVDLAPLTLMNLLVTPAWWAPAALARVRAKHERVGGPDEQQLADWGRSS